MSHFRFNPRNLRLGVFWLPKPPCLFVNLPMCEWFIEIGQKCSHCCGQGKIFIEAGGGEWDETCEVCEGTGRV